MDFFFLITYHNINYQIKYLMNFFVALLKKVEEARSLKEIWKWDKIYNIDKLFKKTIFEMMKVSVNQLSLLTCTLIILIKSSVNNQVGVGC